MKNLTLKKYQTITPVNILSKNNFCLMFASNLIMAILFTIAIFMLLFSFVYIQSPVIGESMFPTLNYQGSQKSDIVFVNKFESYGYGDLIVVNNGTNSKIIKRLIGVSGDKINYKIVNDSVVLTRNGEVLNENYLNKKLNATLIVDSITYNNENGMAIYINRFITLKLLNPQDFDEEENYIVPDNCIFALGDNRSVSLDSSVNGAYSILNIEGRVDFIKYYGQTTIDFILKNILVY